MSVLQLFPLPLNSSIGYQYEFLLAEKVIELGIPFLGQLSLENQSYKIFYY